jgi:hypothetical protein
MAGSYTHTPFIKRLDMFIKSNHPSRTAFCEEIGFPVPTLNGYFSRGVNPGFTFFDKFLDVYSVQELQWIFKGEQIQSNLAGEPKAVYLKSANPYENFQLAFKEVVQYEIQNK